MTSARSPWDRLFSGLCALTLLGMLIGATAVLAVVATKNLPWWGWGAAAGWLLLAAFLAALAARAQLWRAALVCGFVALVLRLAALLATDLTGVYTGNDYAAYLTLANNLLDGRGFVAPTSHYGIVTGMYPPLYPVLLAAAGALFGVNSVSVLMVNSLLELGSAGLLFVIARRLGEERAGLAAGALYLIWPGFVLSAPLAQKESLIVFLTLLLAWLFVRALQGGRDWKTAGGFGLGAALLALCQPALLPLPLFLGLMLLPALGLRRTAWFAARALPFAIALMLPWWLRNWAVFGTFVPLTTSLGPSMMVAVAGVHNILPPETAALAEPARSSAMAGEAAAAIAADPVGFLFRRVFAVAESLSFERHAAWRLGGFRPPFAWATAMYPAMQVAHVAAAGTALWAVTRSKASPGRRIAVMLLGAALLQILFVQPWFELAERHRHFMAPFILLLAGLALVELIGTQRPISPSPGDRCIGGAMTD